MDDKLSEELRQRVFELRTEHRNLDVVIGNLSADPTVDQLQLRRLKKRKLLLKDFIARLESQMIPDLNA
ncbi:MAG: YdcH family protein [Acidiferrobacterales bacterium]